MPLRRKSPNITTPLNQQHQRTRTNPPRRHPLPRPPNLIALSPPKFTFRSTSHQLILPTPIQAAVLIEPPPRDLRTLFVREEATRGGERDGTGGVGRDLEVLARGHGRVVGGEEEGGGGGGRAEEDEGLGGGHEVGGADPEGAWVWGVSGYMEEEEGAGVAGNVMGMVGRLKGGMEDLPLA